ncbi:MULTISPECIES: DUF4389 domain-containing protein [Pseudomonas]|uniref:DUF4389 domain-containing protein n=2 Tax=Pseudomonas TaxID=286 RepID=A0A2X2CMV5_PSELU|nr:MULTISPECIES: DUF4389 domain-containing protein [Pseudomonas]ENA30771.1 hypothetical protein HMPREF1487_07671 [Pseudomonas sp. HPB0071]MBA1250779.1 DUF4389 domain-containing protein [Pseudomonas zeshuii]MBF8643465.1 DUF4389 domain-containing protein [Pseudomonas zeshuii]QEU29512.1 DUF4389 domain-containing protein [Pseudomonas luteola]RRW42364.1 DUF4389 domain-containing protein [Pseudomonas luteola]
MSADTHERESLALRLIWMVIFLLVWLVSQYIFAGVVIAQLGYRLVKGTPSDALSEFGSSLSCYLAQIVRFGTFATEEKPWPLADWPDTASSMQEKQP